MEHFIPLALVVIILIPAVALIVNAVSGKDFWPFSVKGPFESFRESAWRQDAYRDFGKKVPPPAEGDPKSA